METESDFIRREIAVWGESYIEELLERGYVPILLTDFNDIQSWSWILSIKQGVAVNGHI